MTDRDPRFTDIRDFYDNEYYADNSGAEGVPWHTRRVAGRLGPLDGRVVLDVACGTGEWLAELASRGAGISGIDLSTRAIDRCVARWPGGDFKVGPAETLPWADNTFDLITCMGSLEHFVDKPAALAEMHRVARPGGQFLVLVPNAGFLTRRLHLYGGTHQTRAREDVYELDEWQRIFSDAGMVTTQRWRDLHPLSMGWITQAPAWSWPVRATQALALAIWPVAWQYQVYFHGHFDDVLAMG